MGMIWAGHALTGAEAEALQANPDSIWELVEEEREPPAGVDLDKAWHAIHWLLTEAAGSTDHPLAHAIMGGKEFGDDNGYGPPRLLDATGAATVAAALDQITITDLRTHYDPATLTAAKVYPEIWTDNEIFDSYLAPHFEDLKSLYTYAATEGRWVLQSLM